jgi:hypothetical protein
MALQYLLKVGNVPLTKLAIIIPQFLLFFVLKLCLVPFISNLATICLDLDAGRAGVCAGPA